MHTLLSIGTWINDIAFYTGSLISGLLVVASRAITYFIKK